MMKFFRKYNKQLLAVFMVLLMIVFIGGSALQSMLSTRQDRKIAESRDGDITLIQQQDANATTELLTAVGINWRSPLYGGQPPIETVDWILLLREAKRLGYKPDVTEARVSAEASGASDIIRSVARARGIKTDVVYDAMAQFRAISNAAYAIAGATRPSEAELRATARDALEQVKIRAIILPADAFVDESEVIPESELQAHFEKYKATEKGRGMNFGYYQYPRLKVQYVKIDRDAIMESIGIANIERKAKGYYEKNKETDRLFRRDTEVPATADGPSAEDAGKAYLDWDEAKNIAIAAVKKQHATEAAHQLANWLTQYASGPWADAERGDDGYKVVPEVAKSPDFYTKMIERIPNSLRFPGAVTIGETAFFEGAEASELPELGGTAFRPERGAPKSFISLAFTSKPIVNEVPKDAVSGSADFIAPFQTCDYPVVDSKRQYHYVFRIIDSKPGRPASSLAEVRDEVVADVRLVHAMAAAEARAEKLTKGYDTIQDAYELDPDLAAFRESETAGISSGYFEPTPFARVSRGDAMGGRMSRGIWAGVGLGVLSPDIVAGCFALDPETNKVGIFPMPDRAAVLLAESVEVIRADEDEFNELRDSLKTQLAGARFRDAVMEWLTPEKIQARTEFKIEQN
jgi:hypothetical protein